MSASNDTPVLPRPVGPLPDYAHASARKSLGDKLMEAFRLSRPAAMAIANAVVDPATVRKGIGEPSDPIAERIPVQGGGTLLGLRSPVWARKVMPDPRNPRILPARKHPFAVDPGLGKEDSRFRPVPEPRTPPGVAPVTAELMVDIESRHHLIWASQQAASFVLETNNWRESIRTQGVMEPVWLVPTTYRHADGAEPATALISAEGSSRLTADHDILGIQSADVPYEDLDAKFRALIARLNKSLASGGPTQDDIAALRCERVPALIIVGFIPHRDSNTGFPTALKSLVAIRHVDPPTPWGEGPENEALADEVLDEMERRGIISQTQASYFAGACTREEAAAAHLSSDPARRAAEIMGLFTHPDSRYREAIRVAVTSQSTRKNVNQGLLNALATALILRAVSDEPGQKDQFRRYLRKAFGKAVHGGGWRPTGRDTDALVMDAIGEIKSSVAAGRPNDPGPSTLELAVRAAFPLVVEGRLSGDRGTLNNSQPDRRLPGEVLDAMRQVPLGIQQLGQALRDHSAGYPIRIVDESGALALADDGSERIVTDNFLREEFTPAGKPKGQRSGDTPTDRYLNAVASLARAMESVESAFDNLGRIAGDDGRLMVDVNGVNARDCGAWRDLLRRMDDDFVVWSRTSRRVNGVMSPRPPQEPPEVDDGETESNDAEDEDTADMQQAAE